MKPRFSNDDANFDVFYLLLPMHVISGKLQLMNICLQVITHMGSLILHYCKLWRYSNYILITST